MEKRESNDILVMVSKIKYASVLVSISHIVLLCLSVYFYSSTRHSESVILRQFGTLALLSLLVQVLVYVRLKFLITLSSIITSIDYNPGTFLNKNPFKLYNNILFVLKDKLFGFNEKYITEGVFIYSLISVSTVVGVINVILNPTFTQVIKSIL